MLTTDLLLDVTRAECLTWASYAFWTLACAWPAWTVAAETHVLLAIVYGALAVLWRSPMAAGASGACLGSLALRTAALDHGAVVGLMGAVVSAVVALLVFAVVHRGADLVDEDGKMEARPLCLALTLAVGLAAMWTVPIADLIGWALR